MSSIPQLHALINIPSIFLLTLCLNLHSSALLFMQRWWTPSGHALTVIFWLTASDPSCESEFANHGKLLERNGWRAHWTREEERGYFRKRVSGMPAVDSTPLSLPPYLSPFPIFESLSEPLSQHQALITQNFSDHRAPLPHTIIIAHCHPTINTHT